MAVVILNFVNEFPNKSKEPVCQKWNGEFPSEYSDRIMWTTSRGDPEYSGEKKPKRILTEISGIFAIMESTQEHSRGKSRQLRRLRRVVALHEPTASPSQPRINHESIFFSFCP